MDIIRDGVVKTRKPHKCWGCRVVMPIGSMVYRVVDTYTGKISTTYWCLACNAVLIELVLGEEGFPYGIIADEYLDLLEQARKEVAK